MSKDPNEARADEMSDDSTDDELINNWIQEAAGFSPQIEGKHDSPFYKCALQLILINKLEF